MRRVGVISDIHGNRLALDAVLAELEAERIDEVVCLGDVAVGPQPREALARVRELGCPVVMGNWDTAFLDGMPSPADEVERKLVEIGRWWADMLTADDRAFMRTFQPTLELTLPGGERMLCYHGSPTSFDDWILATTSDEEVDRMLGGRAAPLMLGGHTHVQMVRRHRHSVIVNPGSVGLAFYDWPPARVQVAPWAEYGILSWDAGRLGIELRRTTFDVAGLLQLSLASGMPHAEWWAGTWSAEASLQSAEAG
ncbi:MAG TPA: metallophosphoesterase family protein [Longimicrobiales bacterium]|nr:metallophosphoesterase family protein [Longimicrobiales bacterium]